MLFSFLNAWAARPILVDTFSIHGDAYTFMMLSIWTPGITKRCSCSKSDFPGPGPSNFSQSKDIEPISLHLLEHLSSLARLVHRAHIPRTHSQRVLRRRQWWSRTRNALSALVPGRHTRYIDRHLRRLSQDLIIWISSCRRFCSVSFFTWWLAGPTHNPLPFSSWTWDQAMAGLMPYKV